MPTAQPSLSLAKTQVALVDDDPQILEALSTFLNMLGLLPCPFRSAEALLAALQAPSSDLQQGLAGAILDINLGGMHGIELAHQLRLAHPHIPIVMISALNPQEISRLGQLPERASCLHKPFNISDLEDALFEWIH